MEKIATVKENLRQVFVEEYLAEATQKDGLMSVNGIGKHWNVWARIFTPWKETSRSHHPGMFSMTTV